MLSTLYFPNLGYLPPATKLGQGYVFTRVCDSVHREGGLGVMVSQHTLQQVSWGCLNMPCRFPGPHPGGKLRDLARGVLQVHTWGSLGPNQAGGVSRPTPGGSPGPHPGVSPGPHLGGSPGPHPGVGGVSRPTPSGVYPSMD